MAITVPIAAKVLVPVLRLVDLGNLLARTAGMAA